MTSKNTKKNAYFTPVDGSPLVGELFLRFCAFVRQLGGPRGEETMAYTVLNLLDDGEVEEGLAVETWPTENKGTAGGDEVSVLMRMCQVVWIAASLLGRETR